MTERILEEFEDFDCLSPIEHDESVSARRIRAGKRFYELRMKLSREGLKKIGSRQRKDFSMRKRHPPKVTLATKA
jgi:hypothetical protein